MNLLKFINVFILQWFFIRLAKNQETIIDSYRFESYGLMPSGHMSSRGTGTTATHQWYALISFVLPLTGWWSDYIFLSHKRSTPLTKKKVISNGTI